MSSGPDDPNVEIYSSGVNAQSGVEQPVTADDLMRQAQYAQPDREEQREIRFWSSYLNTGQWGLVEGMNPDRLEEAGWGVVFGMYTAPEVREALQPLLDWRREQAGERYREFFGSGGVRAGESKNNWLRRQGAEAGRVDPERVPYYLLMVGSAEEIPFRFQSQFLQYAVGRLYFETPEAYHNYAVSVVEAEKAALRLPRRLSLFNPVHEGDIASSYFADRVTGAMAKELHSVSAIKGWVGEPWAIAPVIGMEATRDRFASMLREESSPLIFTASHGMLFPPGDPSQIPVQGALVTADWPGKSVSVAPEHVFTGDDLPPDAALWGLVAMLLTNYSVGTPQMDESLPGESQRMDPAAERPFFARLPMRMLSHPRGGALAVIGTTGKLWVLPGEREPSTMYRDVLRNLMTGQTLGRAMSVFSERYAEASTALSDMQQEMGAGLKVNRAEFVAMWQESYNARSMILLGDPAVRLPVGGEAPVTKGLEQSRPALELIGAQQAMAEPPVVDVTAAGNAAPSLDTAVAGVEVTTVPSETVTVGSDAPTPVVETPAAPPAIAEPDVAQQAPSRAQRAAESPYVGPRSFRIGESFFYGRDREAAALVGLVIAERIVLLYSPSGAGKSSLLNARVVPDLVEQGFRVMQTIRVNLEPPKAFASMDGFNRYVYSALLSLEEGYPGNRRYAPEELSRMTLDAYLKRRAEEDAKEREERKAQGLLSASELDRERALTVLVLDQFEEIITTNPTDRVGRQAFFNQAGIALRERNRYGLFVMREDYIAAIDPYLRPIPTRLSNRFRLDLLGRAGAMEAIQKPAADVGVTFEDSAAEKLVRDLCTINVQQPDGTLEPVEGIYVEPVQLQVVCSKLWQDLPQDDVNISLDDVDRLGKTDAALSDYYGLIVKDVAAKTGVRERSIRRWFDTRLITRQGIRGQVLLGPKETEGLPNTALRQLETFYLVRGEKRGGATWYELSHDRLLKPVRDNNEAWFSDHLSQLQRQAEAWQENSRPDSLLLAGVDLDEAERWAKENEKEMEPVEREFLAESIQTREEQRRREEEAVRREQDAKRISRLATISTVFSVMAVVAGIIAAVTIINSNRDQRVAEARQAAQLAIGSVENDPQQALVYALQSINLAGGVDNASWEAINAIRQALPANRMTLTMRGHEGPAYTVAYSPDGARIAAGGADGMLHVLDAATGQEVFSVQVAARPADAVPATEDAQQRERPATSTQRAVSQVLYSPDGAAIAVAGSSGVPALYDAETGQFIASFGSPDNGAVRAISFSPNGSWLAAGYFDGTVLVWNVEDGAEVMWADTDTVTSLAFDPSGERIIVADDSGLVLLRVEDGETLWDLYRSIEELANEVIFSPDGEWYITANADGDIWQNPINDDSESFLFQGHSNPVTSVAYSPDGLYLVSTSTDNTVRIWNTESRQEDIVLTGHTGPVNDAAYSPDGRYVASASDDGSVRVWDISPAGGNELWTIDQLDINSLTYTSADGGRLATSQWAIGITVWEAATHTKLFSIPSDGFHFWYVRYSPDGSKLAAIFENSYYIWNASDGQKLLELPEESFPSSLAWSADGTRLITGNQNGLIRVWDAANGTEILTIPIPPEIASLSDGVESLAFHPTKNWIAAEYNQGGWILWDMDTREQIQHVREGYERGVAGLDFVQASDGTIHLLVAESQGNLNQYRLDDTGEIAKVATFLSQPGQDTAIAVRENQFVFSGQFQAIFQTDAESLSVVDELYGHNGKIIELAFHEDGQTIYSAGDDGTLRAHTLNEEVLVELARQRVRQGLDDTQCQYYGLDACP